MACKVEATSLIEFSDGYEEEGEDGEARSRPPGRHHVSFPRPMMIVGFALAIAFGTWVAASRAASQWRSAHPYHSDLATPESKVGSETCVGWKKVLFKSVVYNNLGGAGPDKGPHGMLLRGMAVDPASNKQRMLYFLVTNVTAYHPWAQENNGLRIPGGFAYVTQKAGQSVRLKFEVFYDRPRLPGFPTMDCTEDTPSAMPMQMVADEFDEHGNPTDDVTLKGLDIPTGRYTEIFKLPASATSEPFTRVNGCGVNPKDSILYCFVKVKNKPLISRVGADVVEHVARAKLWSFSATFDEEGRFWWHSDDRLYWLGDLHTMPGFTRHDDEDLPDLSEKSFWQLDQNVKGADLATMKKGDQTLILTMTKEYIWSISLEEDGTIKAKKQRAPEIKGYNGMYGAAWSYQGKIYFSRNDGGGVYEVDPDSIRNGGEANIVRVGSSDPTDKNDGANCMELVTPFPTATTTTTTTSTASTATTSLTSTTQTSVTVTTTTTITTTTITTMTTTDTSTMTSTTSTTTTFVLTLKDWSLTFVDLDTGSQPENDGDNVEKLKVDRSQYKGSHTTAGSTLTKTAQGEFDIWTATTYGAKADNPQLPATTTEEQWNKAVTFDFATFYSFEFEWGSTSGHFDRFLGFALQPGTQCALNT